MFLSFKDIFLWDGYFDIEATMYRHDSKKNKKKNQRKIMVMRWLWHRDMSFFSGFLVVLFQKSLSNFIIPITEFQLFFFFLMRFVQFFLYILLYML